MASVAEKMKDQKRTGYKAGQRQNILEICLYTLDALHRGENPTTKELAVRFETSIRNIQNYMKELEFLGVERVGREKRLALKHALSHKQTSLSRDEREFVRSSLEQLQEIDDEHTRLARVVSEKIMVTDVQTPYYIKPENFEPISHRKNLVKDLRSAIDNTLKIELLYEGRGITLFPYKITAFEGIWYLLADGLQEESLQNYMLSRIDDWAVTGERFEPIPNLMEIIEEMESAHSTEGEEQEVVVRVNARIADYFKYKRYLKSQDILEQDAEGNLLISFDITHDEDVDNLIKSWLPDIEVVSPLSFRQRIKRELQAYLDRTANTELSESLESPMT